MIALSLALAYLGTLAFVAWREWHLARCAKGALLESLLARVATLEATAGADQQLRDTVTSLAIAAGMKPRA